MSTPELDSIVFVSIPPEFDRAIGEFQLNPDILLPVEIGGAADSFSPSDLSWEMIISGMLKVLAYEPDHDDADYYREFILAVKPDIVGELTETAILKAKNKDFELAEEIFLALVGLQPNDQRAHLNLALLYEQRAREEKDEATHAAYAEKAFDRYKEILDADEVMPEVHLNAGYCFLEERNFERASHHLQAYIADGNDQEKIEAARKVVSEIESQNLLDTMFKEAYDYIRMGREDEGIARVKEFLRSYPQVWNAWFLLGWGYRRTGQYENGREAFEKALELGPRQPDTLNELAICFMELGQYEKSEHALREALQLEPENVKIVSNLGILALRREDFDEARAYFESALEFDPEDPIAREYLERIPD